ncbi:MAG: acyltransferase family protein [Micrococcaceae bacterium]
MLRANFRREVTFRVDIQFLRFIAILFVFLNHLGLLAGGFLGVDIFFVISGYLIIGHIVRDINRGTFKLGKFYLKRAWRLLPAAFIVLITTFAIALTVVPVHLVKGLHKSFLASWFYVENIHLMNEKTNYFVPDKAIELYQHFWSLGVEEQFYILIPIILFLIPLIFKNYQLDKVIPVILTIVIVLSLGYALLIAIPYYSAESWAQGTPNYFNTFARLWEFAAGGLISFLPRVVKWNIVTTLLVYFSYLLLILCGIFYSENVIFPGIGTLTPVIATLIIIYLGTPKTNRKFERFILFQYIGDISYPIYLWHLPVLLLLPYFGVSIFSDMGHPKNLSICGMFFAIFVTILLAHFTHYYIEKPVQRYRSVVATAEFSGIVFVASCIVILFLNFSQSYAIKYRLSGENVAFQEAVSGTCYQGKTMVSIETNCNSKVFDPPLKPNVSYIDNAFKLDSKCKVSEEKWGRKVHCNYNPKNKKRDILLVGDSHSMQWSPGVIQLAKQQKMNVDAYQASSCPFIDISGQRLFYSEEDDLFSDYTSRCNEANKQIMKYLKTYKPTHVVVSNFAHSEYLDDIKNPTISSDKNKGSFTLSNKTIAELKTKTDSILEKRVPSRIKEVKKYSKTITYIKDTPYNRDYTGRDCLEINKYNLENCTYTPSDADIDDKQFDIVKNQTISGVSIVNMDDFICGIQCHGAVNGLPIYYDGHHLSNNFVNTIKVPLANEIKRSWNKNNATQ